MKVETIAIGDLAYDSENARKHSIRNLAAIKESLSRFGQQKPILIDGNNVVKAGNGTLKAASELGWESIQCVRTELDGAELAAFAIADNRTAELAEWDMEILVDQLQGLGELDDDLLGAAGFNEGELGALLVSFEPDTGEDVNDAEQEWKNMPEFQQKNSVHRSLIVHFASQEHFETFCQLVERTVGEKTKFIWYPEDLWVDSSDQRVVAEG